MASTKNSADTITDIQEDISALRDDLAKLMKQVTVLIGESSDEASDEVKTRFRRMRKGLDKTVADLSERGRETLSQASDTVVEGLDESLRNHPLASLGIAVGLGFIVGSVSARR